jgi:alcohol dehydrogenase
MQTPFATASFESPLKIDCGDQALSHLPFELGIRRLRTPFILADREAIGEKRVRRVVDAFRSSGLSLGLYDRLAETREDDLLPALARMYHDGCCDCIVAAGNGSVVDTAKCLNLFVSGVVVGDETDADIGPLRPLVIVATPGGDGYEATGHAIDNKKRLCAPQLAPRVAVIDPEMMAGTTKRDIVSGAMIGLVQAIERFLDERSGPFARAYAHTAISLIFENLPAALEAGKYRDSRLTALVNGQIVAGCTFDAAAPGLCHHIAHRLIGDSEADVGILMAILLPHLVNVAGGVSPEVVGPLLYPLAGPDVYAQMAETLKIPRIIAMLVEFFHAINGLLSDPIPLALNDSGLPVMQIDTVRQKAGAGGENPVVCIIDSALKGMAHLTG